MVQHPKFRHHQLLPEEQCPEGFDGTYALGCKSGLVSVTKGVCNKHCVAGTARAGNVDVQHGAMLHGNYSQPKCPSSGHIVLSCLDGQITVLEGRCWADCVQGAAKDETGTVVLHGNLKHEDSGMGTCGEGATGQVGISCFDGAVTVNSTAEVRCYRHCPASTLTTNENVEISHGNLEHNTEATLECPVNLLGTVRMRCSDGKTSLLDGGCGSQNCADGSIDSNGAEIPHPSMNDGKSSGPFSCPAPFSGEAAITCNKGESHASKVTLYDEEYDETFTLCRCCELQQTAPPPPVLEPEEQKVSLIAVSLGLLAGCLCAAMTGYHFLSRDKLSKVLPEDNAEKGSFFQRFRRRSSQSKGSQRDSKGSQRGSTKAKSEGGIKEKLVSVLKLFVGVFLCGFVLTRIANCLRDACDSCKERRSRKKEAKNPKKENPNKELREAGDSEAAPDAPADAEPQGP